MLTLANISSPIYGGSGRLLALDGGTRYSRAPYERCSPYRPCGVLIRVTGHLPRFGSNPQVGEEGGVIFPVCSLLVLPSQSAGVSAIKQQSEIESSIDRALHKRFTKIVCGRLVREV